MAVRGAVTSLPARGRTETELVAMPILMLLAELCAARDAGQEIVARRCRGVLAGRRLPEIRGTVARRVPAPDVADVLADVSEHALRSRFRQSTLPEFDAWLRRIARR